MLQQQAALALVRSLDCCNLTEALHKVLAKLKPQPLALADACELSFVC